MMKIKFANRLFALTVICLVLFGCVSAVPEKPDPRTGRLTEAVPIKKNEILRARPIVLSNYHFVVLTGLANDPYVEGTLLHMHLFQQIETPGTLISRTSFSGKELDIVKNEIDTDYGKKALAKTFKKILFLDIQGDLDNGGIVLTVADPLQKAPYLEIHAKESFPIMYGLKGANRSLLNAVADWVEKNKSR